ncbi:hypothetical protein CYY_005391 [Polysphondylium violaceum]|uniref:Uncharacterized protein n=1 Tax=Polysphondylium violaceum TaxID=133409 RepID=A0A8J4V479_9MYCE|nr:hypothetical protein CYY_005391 [Polysphondylium violaceum]
MMSMNIPEIYDSTVSSKKSLFQHIYQKIITSAAPGAANVTDQPTGNTKTLKKKTVSKTIDLLLQQQQLQQQQQQLSSSSSIGVSGGSVGNTPFHIFQTAQLSVWSNTAGPVVEQLWKIKDVPIDFQAFTARQTLCGLDPKNTSDEVRFNMYPEHGFMVLSHIFNSKYTDLLSTKFAFSLYLNISFFNDYLPLHDIIVDRLTFLSCKILKAYTKNIPLENELFSKELINTMINVEKLFIHNGYPNVNISNTWFSDPLVDTDFLIKVLTSHFQTHGSTIIYGSHSEYVLKWMDTLSLFLTTKERKIASRNLNLKEYIPDIIIQGFIDVTQKQIEERLYLSLRPSTIIDIDKQIIYQTRRNHEYLEQRIDLFSKIILENYQMKEIENHLTTFKGNSTYIQKMVNEVFQLPFHFREIFLIQSVKSLLRKSSIIITGLQSLPYNEQKNRIQSLFNPTISETDIEVLYGLAEKLQYYLYVSVSKSQSFAIEDAIMEILSLV